jgi:hypothetical protein
VLATSLSRTNSWKCSRRRKSRSPT